METIVERPGALDVHKEQVPWLPNASLSPRRITHRTLMSQFRCAVGVATQAVWAAVAATPPLMARAWSW